MRWTLWLVGLFSVAVAIALFAGNNDGVVSLFWPPYRIDLSVNLALLLLTALFVALYVALRTVSLFVSLPHEARRWRRSQREQAIFGAFLDALAQLQAGRFSRSRKQAELAIKLQDSWKTDDERPTHADQLRIMSHMVAADSLQALQARDARDAHYAALMELQGVRLGPGVQAAIEGAQIRAARWALDDREPAVALKRLDALPQGVSRRILALRIRLKAARLSGQTRLALETTRALIRHRAFSAVTATSLVRGLVAELVQAAHDPQQLRQVWDSLDAVERSTPQLAVLLAQRMCALAGDRALARGWLLPAWEAMVREPQGFDQQVRDTLVRVLEDAMEEVDSAWLARIEAAQMAAPAAPDLLYLAGVACMKRQLWGKAQQLLGRAAPQLGDPELRRRAWAAMAQLAEQRGDEDAALKAWKLAAATALTR